MSVREESQITIGGEDDPAKSTARPAGKRRLVIGGIAVVAVAAAGTAVALTGGSSRKPPSGAAPATADIVRTDLTDQTQVDGTLGFADSYTVSGSGRGRLTWLPDEGRTIRRGRRVYEVDSRKVPLFYGAVPFWRTLRSGVSDGRDVRELESNLKALGYGDDVTVDDSFTAATAAAVRDWQDDLGVSRTGAVAPGDVVIEPGAVRIKKVGASLGGPAGGQILTANGTAHQITVQLPVNQQELAVDGAKVGVELPGGRTTTGHISSVGTVATASSDSDDQNQAGQDTETATVPVYITLDHGSSAGHLDGAPVTVGFTSSTHKGVLAVPVQALLAQAAGTYAVEVVDSAGRHTVPVELGIFADGKVEVSGSGLTAGMKVEVPRS
jgi:peptidoglycan hydrolase-like protein with peptidoglycan-binding domain